MLGNQPAGFGPGVAGKGPAFGGHLASGLPVYSACQVRRLASVGQSFVRCIDGHPRPDGDLETSPLHGLTVGMG